MRTCQRCGGTGKEPDHREIGAQMRALREKRGRTLRSIARALDLSAAYVSDLELGRRMWRADLLSRYRAAL